MKPEINKSDYYISKSIKFFRRWYEDKPIYKFL